MELENDINDCFKPILYYSTDSLFEINFDSLSIFIAYGGDLIY